MPQTKKLLLIFTLAIMLLLFFILNFKFSKNEKSATLETEFKTITKNTYYNTFTENNGSKTESELSKKLVRFTDGKASVDDFTTDPSSKIYFFVYDKFAFLHDINSDNKKDIITLIKSYSSPDITNEILGGTFITALINKDGKFITIDRPSILTDNDILAGHAFSVNDTRIGSNGNIETMVTLLNTDGSKYRDSIFYSKPCQEGEKYYFVTYQDTPDVKCSYE